MPSSVDQWYVSVEIAGTDVDPEALTRILGVTPTHSSVGELQPVADRLGIPPRRYWILETRGNVAGNRLAEHLRWLGDWLADSSGVLRQLAADGHARILVYGSPDAWECDIAQDQHQRDRLGLPLSFVAFVKGDATVKFFLAEFREP